MIASLVSHVQTPEPLPRPLPMIGIVVALPLEVPRSLRAARAQRSQPALRQLDLPSHSLALTVSGAGLRSAGPAADRLCQAVGPSCLISLGICGATGDHGGGATVAGRSPRRGDLLVAEHVRYHEDTLPADPGWLEWLLATPLGAPEPGRRVLLGELETRDRPATSRRGLAATALGIDMEAYAVFSSASRHGVPALAVKAVSDILLEQPGPLGLLRWLVGWPAGLRRAISALDYLGARLCAIAADFPVRGQRLPEPLFER